MRFLLSIHDVWPGNFLVVEDHCRRLRSLGAGHFALLVVPFFHGRKAMAADAEFLAWLRDKETAGCEVFLHGYRHLMRERLDGAPATGPRGYWGRWVNRNLVAGEAEFCGLNAADRAELLRLGHEAMSAAGFRATGFVAPTWHGAPDPEALKARGLGIWESRFWLRHLPSGRSRFAPPLAFGPPDRNARLMGGPAWLGAMLGLPLIKVALHPGDMESPEVPRVMERVLAGGREIAYSDVFGGPRPK